MKQTETNYETYLVVNALREEHDYVDDIIQIVNSPKPIEEIIRNLRGYVETWFFKGDVNYEKYPLQKALWLSAYCQIDWREVMQCFRYGSDTWAVKDDEK